MQKQYIWFRLLGVALIIPNAIREWVDTLTDIASYQENIAQIIDITSYQPTLYKQFLIAHLHHLGLLILVLLALF